MTALYASGGGVKYAWRKLSSLIALSLEVYKFSSLAEFIEDDCKIISSLYRGRIKVGAIPKGGIKPYTSKLVVTPTSEKGRCKRGKCIELGSILTGLEGRCKRC